MTNLTEQWNEGKLPDGDYYIKRRNGDTLYDNIDSHGVWRNSIDEDIIEVLVEVPSYELWKAVHEQWKVLLEENTQLKKWCEEFNALEVANENTKLKELLKELKRYFDVNGKYYIEKRILLEINQVLGEE